MAADVVLETSNLTLTDAHGRRVDVPANDRVEVRFPVTTDAGRHRALPGQRDAIGGDWPTARPASSRCTRRSTTEAFATYGVVDDGAIAQPLQTPTGVVPQYGGLEVDTSSTAMQALTDAVVYLEDYPYESADAYASRIIALTSLRGRVRRVRRRGRARPRHRSTRGSSPISRRSRRSRTTTAASARGHAAAIRSRTSACRPRKRSCSRGSPASPCPDARATGALAYVRDIESKFPSYWGTQERHAVSAYALQRTQPGRRSRPGEGRGVVPIRSRPRRSTRSRGCGRSSTTRRSTARSRGRSRIARDETPGAATFTAGYDDGAYLVLGSDRRTDGIVLDALITKQPDSDLIPKVVAGLIGNQVKGRWDNIQENGFILVALQRYFAKYEAQTPVVRRAGLARRHVCGRALVPRPFDRPATHARAR